MRLLGASHPRPTTQFDRLAKLREFAVCAKRAGKVDAEHNQPSAIARKRHDVDISMR